MARLLVAAAVAATALTGAILPASAASAAEVPDAITSVTTDKADYGYYERISLNFDWAVPDSTIAGDTFTLDLPDALKALTLAKFSLQSADGSVVANAAWDGKTVVFTLTDYVNNHEAVSGTGFLTVQWDHLFTSETSEPLVLDFNGTIVRVVIDDKPAPAPACTENCPAPKPTPTSRSLSKSGGWTDGSYEGTRDETNNLWWSVRLPGNEDGFTGPITIVDTPNLGSTLECESLSLVTQTTLENTASRTVVDPSRYTATCTTSALSITLDTINPSEFISVSYEGTITDQRSGSYGNNVVVTIAGVTTEKVKKINRLDAAGGIGGGIQNVSVGDYVWLDVNRDGIQDSSDKGIAGVTLELTGPTGEAVTDVNGTLVAPVVTDGDGGYTFDNLPLLPAGQHYTVAIDREGSAEALDVLLPTIAGAGEDRSVDSSSWTAESIDLTTNGARDSTLDFGFVTLALPVSELPTLALPAGDEPVVLAYTGDAGILPMLLGGLTLLLSGAGALVLGRRVKRA